MGPPTSAKQWFRPNEGIGTKGHFALLLGSDVLSIMSHSIRIDVTYSDVAIESFYGDEYGVNVAWYTPPVLVALHRLVAVRTCTREFWEQLSFLLPTPFPVW